MSRFLDLGWQTSHVSDIEAAIQRDLLSGVYIGGPEVERFESNFATYISSDYCVGVGNGLDALKLSLLAAGVKPGDEVIVPAFTFIATWLAVSSIGAKVVPVDVCPSDLSLNSNLIKSVITEKTKAIIPVFIFGKVCNDLSKIIAIAQERNLFLLFDAAQSAGAAYINQLNKRDMVNYAMAWSFYPGKNLGAIGDAGAVTTNSQKIAESVYSLRNYGANVKYIHTEKGFNSRLDSMQAAILSEKLRYLNSWNERRKEQVRIYDEISSEYVKPMFDSGTSGLTNWHLYPIQTIYRDCFLKYLNKNGVETGIHYPVPPYLQQCFEELSLSASDFMVATSASSKISSLPIGPHLSDGEVKKIVDLTNKFKPS